MGELLSTTNPHPPPSLLSSMQAIQNLGLAVVAIVAGKIVDEKGYLVYEVFNCALLCRESSLATWVVALGGGGGGSPLGGGGGAAASWWCGRPVHIADPLPAVQSPAPLHYNIQST